MSRPDSLRRRIDRGTGHPRHAFRSVNLQQQHPGTHLSRVKFVIGDPQRVRLLSQLFRLADLATIERGASGAALGALRQMERLADETMDFDAAERERTMRDGNLAQEHAQHLPKSTGNLYLMPSGKLINADDPLYNPTVIAETPEQAFSDIPKEGQRQ